MKTAFLYVAAISKSLYKISKSANIQQSSKYHQLVENLMFDVSTSCVVQLIDMFVYYLTHLFLFRFFVTEKYKSIKAMEDDFYQKIIEG